MFTGIIQAIGTLHRVDTKAGDLQLYIRSGRLDLSDVAPGDSIAVHGICLTAVALPGDGFKADVSRETLQHTNLQGLQPGARLNLEKALSLNSRLGGHLVSGHVDGVGELLARHQDARSARFLIQAPDELARYIAPKGSICVDGVSLTVNRVDGSRFELNLVPHTLRETTLQDYRAGQRVNLEVDLIARYLERLLSGGGETATLDPGVTEALLRRRGFLR